MGQVFRKLFDTFFGNSEMRVVMLGLDAAGKTTILYKLHIGEVLSTVPTIGFNVEKVQYKNVMFTVWDVGGQEKLRPLWRHYFNNTDGLEWEETIFKQEQSAASASETKMSLPSMPSKYITSFLNQACVEIRRAGGHVLDKLTLQSFVSTLLEKVLGIYGDFLSNEEAFDTRVSKEGVLQILLDLGFSADILSGGDFVGREDVSASSNVETSNEKIQR